MTEPNDRELEQYLKGGSALSRRYRDASREQAPPQLDETVLALARAQAQRKPSAKAWMSGLALAASLALGVNLAWNLREQAAPSVTQKMDRYGEESADAAAAPEPVAAPKPEARADAPPAAAPPHAKRRAPPAAVEAPLADSGAGAAGQAAAYESKQEAVREELERERSAAAKQAREENKQTQAFFSAPTAGTALAEPAATGWHGWGLRGAAAEDYRIGLNNRHQVSGSNSLTIASRDFPAVGGHGPPRDFGTLTHSVSAAEFRGGRVVFEAWLRAEDVADWTGLWLRVDSAGGKVLRFENTYRQPIRGSQDWQAASLALDVPAEAERILFGVVLRGSGRTFIDAARLSTGDPSGPEYFYDFEERQVGR